MQTTVAAIVGITILVITILNFKFNKAVESLKKLSLKLCGVSETEVYHFVFLENKDPIAIRLWVGVMLKNLLLLVLILVLLSKFQSELIAIHFKLIYGSGIVAKIVSHMPRWLMFFFKLDIMAIWILAIVLFQSFKSLLYCLKALLEIPVAFIVQFRDPLPPLIVWWKFFPPRKYWRASRAPTK